MGLQGSRNVDFGQFSQLQLCEPIFGSDKVVLACRPLGMTYVESCWGSIRVIPANMSAQWASRGPQMMILASLPNSSFVCTFLAQTKWF